MNLLPNVHTVLLAIKRSPLSMQKTCAVKINILGICCIPAQVRGGRFAYSSSLSSFSAWRGIGLRTRVYWAALRGASTAAASAERGTTAEAALSAASRESHRRRSGIPLIQNQFFGS